MPGVGGKGLALRPWLRVALLGGKGDATLYSPFREPPYFPGGRQCPLGGLGRTRSSREESGVRSLI